MAKKKKRLINILDYISIGIGVIAIIILVVAIIFSLR
jgi:hypothetical protein